MQKAEAVERRKAERERVYLPPAEVTRSPSTSASGSGAAVASTSSSHSGKGASDDVDVAAIKKKVSKALKKVQ